MTAAAIILAAGGSRRLGRPKQIEVVGSETLLERAVRVSREAGLSPVVVVLGAAFESIREQTDLRGCVVVVHREWHRGLASSLTLGAHAVGGLRGAVVLACDMPMVTEAHLRELSRTGELSASSYDGVLGVPAYFPASAMGALEGLTGDVGARELLRGARGVPLRRGELDVDTEEDLLRARRELTAVEER